MKELSSMASVILAKVMLVIALVTAVQSCKTSCHCKESKGCVRIPHNSYEAFGFTKTQEPKDYQQLNWIKMKTAIIYNITSQTKNFACYAHSKGARVVLQFTPSESIISLTDEKMRHLFHELMNKVKDNRLDGIHVAYEGAIPGKGLLYKQFTKFMWSLWLKMWETDPVNRIPYPRTAKRRLATQRISERTWKNVVEGKGKRPDIHYTLSLDYVYCPTCLPDRTYDFTKLSTFLDYFIIKDYDMQVRYPRPGGLCLATANAPLPKIRKYLEDFITHGVSSRKLVMALPWYGYKQRCVKFSSSTQSCHIQCGDLNNEKNQICYKTVLDYIRKYKGNEVKYGKDTKAPYFSFKNEEGERYQINFDDPKSLREKYNIAIAHDIGGVATLHVSCLDLSTESRRYEATYMWNALTYGFKTII